MFKRHYQIRLHYFLTLCLEVFSQAFHSKAPVLLNVKILIVHSTVHQFQPRIYYCTSLLIKTKILQSFIICIVEEYHHLKWLKSFITSLKLYVLCFFIYKDAFLLTSSFRLKKLMNLDFLLKLTFLDHLQTNKVNNNVVEVKHYSTLKVHIKGHGLHVMFKGISLICLYIFFKSVVSLFTFPLILISFQMLLF